MELHIPLKRTSKSLESKDSFEALINTLATKSTLDEHNQIILSDI